MNTKLNRNFYRETVQQSGVGDGKIIRQRDSICVYAHVQVQIRSKSWRGYDLCLER